MFLSLSLQGTGATNPAVIVVAIIAGFIAFIVLRTVFRALNFVLGLGCTVIVAVIVFLILRSLIK